MLLLYLLQLLPLAARSTHLCASCVKTLSLRFLSFLYHQNKCLLVIDSPHAGKTTVCIHPIYFPHDLIHLYKITPQPLALQGIKSLPAQTLRCSNWTQHASAASLMSCHCNIASPNSIFNLHVDEGQCDKSLHHHPIYLWLHFQWTKYYPLILAPHGLTAHWYGTVCVLTAHRSHCSLSYYILILVPFDIPLEISIPLDVLHHVSLLFSLVVSMFLSVDIAEQTYLLTVTQTENTQPIVSILAPSRAIMGMPYNWISLTLASNSTLIILTI